MLETWIWINKIFCMQSNLRLRTLKLHNTNLPFIKFAFILFELLILNTALSSWCAEPIISRMLLYDFAVWLYSPNVVFFSVILRPDKPACILKEIPCSAVSAEEHTKRSWPCSWSGYLVKDYSDEPIWNIPFCSNIRPCWIFIESFIRQMSKWLTTVTSILTYLSI